MTADPITPTTAVPTHGIATAHRGPIGERGVAGSTPATVPPSVSLPIGDVLWPRFRTDGHRGGRTDPSFVGNCARSELRWG